MTSASIVFKNFKQQFTKSVNEMAHITGCQAPDVPATLAFPRIKGFFTVYPEVHVRCLAKLARKADVREFYDYCNVDMPIEVTDEQMELLRPVFYRLAKTIPPINA